MSDSNDSAGGGGAGGSSGCCVGCAELRRKLAKQEDMLNDIKEELEDQKSTIRGLELAMKEQMKAAANVRKKSFMVAHASPLIDGSSEPPSR
jgi:hypothetical protein